MSSVPQLVRKESIGPGKGRRVWRPFGPDHNRADPEAIQMLGDVRLVGSEAKRKVDNGEEKGRAVPIIKTCGVN